MGAKLGLQFAFGTHINRIGITAGAYYLYKNVQINVLENATYNFKSYGPKGKFWELQSSAGLSLGFGKTEMETRNISFMQLQYNASNKNNVLAYGITYYANTQSTSQFTGTFAFTNKAFTISTQNDALALMAWDRFKTGSVQASYIYKNIMLSSQLFLWTGEANKTPKIISAIGAKKIRSSNLSNAKFGKYSHGILNIQAHVALPYKQNIGFAFGADDERIRNFTQNKIMHTSNILGNINKKVITSEIPMLDNNGMPYLNAKEQKLKKPKLFLQVLGNDFCE